MIRNYEDIMKRMDGMSGGQDTFQDFSKMDKNSYTPEETQDMNSMGMGNQAIVPQSSGQQVTPDTSGTSQASTVGKGMMMTGNPYLMATGLGLEVVGKSKERELKREATNINNEIARRDKVMQMMGQLGSGFGRLG